MAEKNELIQHREPAGPKQTLELIQFELIHCLFTKKMKDFGLDMTNA